MGMSAITIVKATTNSKIPRQPMAANGKILLTFLLRNIIMQEQFQDRKRDVPGRGYRNYHRFTLSDLRERGDVVLFYLFYE
jgi:hypothetical protein